VKTQGAVIAWVAAAGVVLCVAIAFRIRHQSRNEAFFTSRGGRDEEADAQAAVLETEG